QGSDRVYDKDFELWDSRGGGWAIPTLHIRNAGRRSHPGATNRRPYAVATENGKTYRVGLGPHVEETHPVWVKKSRLQALLKFIELKNGGEGSAGQIRDRISSRRAQGQVMRAEGRSSWRWDA